MTRHRARPFPLCLLALVPLAACGGPGHLRSESAAAPAESPASRLTVERIFASDDFAVRGFGPVRWLEDGGWSTVEDQGAGNEIVRYEPATGERRVLVAAAALTPPGAEKPLRVADYQWSPDGRKLLIFTNTRRVWRYHTRGDYWVLDLAGGGLRRLGAGLDPTWLQFAKFSPDGGRVAYVYRNDIWVEELDTDGPPRRLTFGGSDTVSHGTFDWVYEEEWGLRDGFRWSPDGRWIAFWEIDDDGVGVYTLQNLTAGLYPIEKRIPYPKAGTTNPICRIGVVAADGGEPVWLELPGDPRDDYVARMEWAAGSDHELVLQRINRRQDTNRVLLADDRTGACREVFADHDPAWVEVCDDLVWIEGGAAFTWLSERDGWRHLWRVPRAGGEPELISDFAGDVIEVLLVDEKAGRVWFLASPEDPGRRFLFVVPLAGGRPDRVTPPGGGWHDYQISRDGRWAIHTVSSFATPPRIELVSLPDHRVRRVFEDNSEVRAALAGLARSEELFFRLERDDGPPLDGWMIKPPDFDPARRWPAIFHVYGEPAGQTVTDRWGGRTGLWHRLLAQQGYVVISVDNRGTPAPRGREWRKCVYGQIGVLAAEDQAAAARGLCAEYPWLDPERLGIWGWSGGGSQTLNSLFRHPEVWAAGIAVAAVPDQRLYDTIYQERYMNTPQANPAGYRAGSPITFAAGLADPLLLVHGTGDDNVHYQGCALLIDELVRLGKPFDMMAYPNRSHGIYEGEGTTTHLYHTMLRWWLAHLPAGPR
ncbi:MAG: S9 family peptidase [Planctomycetota bacterium]|nr:MAG: S9 family peptidase [Planctomycetota bacterium]